MRKKTFFLLFLTAFSWSSNAQLSKHDTTFTKPTITHAIIPLMLIGGGLALKNSDFHDKQVIWHNNNYKDFTNHTDDFIQFAPHVGLIGLDAIGIKSKHNLGDKVGLLLTGGVVMLGTVFLSKSLTKELRPDNTTFDSFPSGHTANAFLGATILAKEYSDESILIPITGYSVATATGVFRILNNRHWTSDVLVGAGVGILSGEVAYLIYPWVKEKIGGKSRKNNISLMPTYNGITIGGSLTMNF